MKPKTVPLLVWGGILALMAVQAASYYPRLPDMVASHFNLAGQADGWSSKSTLLFSYGVSVVVCVGALLAPALFLPKVPVALINLPHKEYWLAPERRQETFSRVSVALLWFGVAVEVLLGWMFQQTIAVNLGRATGLTQMWVALAVFAVFTAGWVVWFRRQFPTPPAPPDVG